MILQERVMKLQDHEKKAVETDHDVELPIHKQKELEIALEETKKVNQDLKMENSELAEKLEYVQMLATSALDNEEVQVIKEDSRRLRHQDEDLTKEIGQLQADRCTDVEELVYLIWINACLRHELRNFQPGHDKTLAQDLSKTLSPRKLSSSYLNMQTKKAPWTRDRILWTLILTSGHLHRHRILQTRESRTIHPLILCRLKNQTHQAKRGFLPN